VLRLLVEGLNNKQIAHRLSLSESTVKFHVSSILGKLGAASRTEAVSIAHQHKLIN
jgi:DNA-binding NarL/FixJ family response regulator